MQIWTVNPSDTEDTWEKKETDPFPLPNDQSLLIWLRDRRLADLRTDERHPAYWIVFSKEEAEAIAQMVTPIRSTPPDATLRWCIQPMHHLSVSVSYVSVNTPIAHLNEESRLTICVSHRP